MPGKSKGKPKASLPDVATMWNELRALHDRHLVMEAHLIIEEYLEALLEKLIPNITRGLFKDPASGGLTYEQKCKLFGCFLEKKDFLTFPKMVQTMRNSIVHDRAYAMDKEKFKDFFKKLSPGDREMVLTSPRITAEREVRRCCPSKSKRVLPVLY